MKYIGEFHEILSIVNLDVRMTFSHVVCENLLSSYQEVCKDCSLQCDVIYRAEGQKSANKGRCSLFKQLNAKDKIENNSFH